MAELFRQYKEIGEEGLWSNLEYFLKEIIPVAEECDIKMAIHPDDPPWPIFGLPRIITNEANLDRFLKLVDSKYNGLTLCTGSLGSGSFNDMVKLVDKSIFGLPRIITNEANLDRFLKLVDSKYNGLTLCTGSLGSGSFNDMVKLVDKYSAMGRIHSMDLHFVQDHLEVEVSMIWLN